MFGRLASGRRRNALYVDCACEPVGFGSVYGWRGRRRVGFRHEARANAAREGATKPEAARHEVILY
jgi:hypothetical protein